APVSTTVAAPVSTTVAAPVSTTVAAPLSNIPTLSGIPVSASNVDVAKNAFKSTIDGLSGFFAEPGKLMVPQKDCASDSWKAKIKAANGAITCFDPLNQYVVQVKESETNVPSGGFALYTLGGGDAQINGVKISMPFQAPCVSYILAVRGKYGDGKQDTDENTTLYLTGHKPGFVQYRMYSAKPNGGFISEEQLVQEVQSMHEGNTNCGDAGSSHVLVIAYDTNTGASAIISHKNGKFNLVAKNY
ncbi:MAG: hypothetical protein WCJ70_02075, partial [bacterium]